MTVDRSYTEKWTTTGSFSMLSSNKVFIGGSSQPYKLPGSKTKTNFVGCMKKVRTYPWWAVWFSCPSYHTKVNQKISIYGTKSIRGEPFFKRWAKSKRKCSNSLMSNKHLVKNDPIFFSSNDLIAFSSLWRKYVQ